MRHLAKAWVAAGIVLLIVTPLMAQTTGRITGQVVDNSGASVPGATVSVTSPNLQGTLSSTTDSKGEFRFLSLPPGNYHLKVDLTGFKTIEQNNIQVGLDRTVNLGFKLTVASVVETVTVTGEAPVIDTSSSSTGVNATADLFTRIPVQRDFYAIARVAPGTQEDAVGSVFYGSSGAENSYIVEGLNTTGVQLGDKGKTLNFDFVQEIEVKTGGLPAEYGRMTGGVINVLTKSGGNEFRGSVFGFSQEPGLTSDNKTASLRPATTTQVTDVAHKRDFGGELGGYLLKDKVWFFGAYNRVNELRNVTLIRTLADANGNPIAGAPTKGSVIPADITSDLFAGKLTWRLNADNTLTGSVFGDPKTRDGNIFTIRGPESTWKGTQDTGSTDIVARYDGTFGNSFLIRATYGRHKEKITDGGPGREIPQTQDFTVVPEAYTGGFGFFQDQQFKRDVYKLDLSKFLGTHEIKLGGDIEKVDTVTENYQGGAGQRIYKFRVASTGAIYYRHRYYVNDLAPGYVRSDPFSWQIALPQIAKPNSDGFSGYLQDSWKVAKGFTLNLGVRWERQNIKNRFGDSVIDLKKEWAPRVGFVWDVSNNGKSKLYANFGRFYESIPQDINIRSFGGEAVCFCYNFSPSQNDIRPDPNAPRKSALLGGKEPVDPSLKGQYIDEYLAGFEYEVAPNFALGIKGSYRTLGRVIEDFLVPSSGDYFIANPAEGTLGQQLAFYDGSAPAAAPKAQRKNYSVELTARKRFSNNWQLLASYVWQKLEGNYDGTFQNSTGQLDPNINSAFDYADFLVNSQGLLTAERRHQLKFDGSYQFKGGLEGLNVGLSTYWYSGLPLNAYGYSFAYSNWEYYLAPRGSVGRGPSDYEANLHVNYPVKLGGRARLNLMVDVFNLLNRQAITQLDERYNLIQDGPCAGVPDAGCNGDGGIKTAPGTLTPVIALNPRATATNPDYLKQGVQTTSLLAGYTQPRAIRFGVRLSF